jgi:hypothetical protein
LGWQRSNPPPVAKLRSAGGAEISKPARRKRVKLRADRVSGGTVKWQELSPAADQPTI